MKNYVVNSESASNEFSLENFFSRQLKDTNDLDLYLLCLTTYNEKLSTISETLDSVSLNIESKQLPKDENPVVAFVIIDGQQAADPALIELANRIPEVQKFEDDEAGITYCKTRYNESFGQTADFDIVFVIKADNRGKLDSHRIFFKEICERLNPNICLQADAGTILTEDVLGTLKDTLDHDTQGNVGAGAGMCIEPRENGGLLHSFQTGEFLVQRGIYWSAELFFGYLSVMPGQCSAVRWSALIEKDENNRTPLEGYLRKEEDFTAVDKLAYLAEDRVMGLELFSNAGYKNNITYTPKAIAYTDSCESFTELLKQRRRWINSAFTCRVLMILFFITQLFSDDIPTRKKLKIFSYLTYASALCLTEVLLPVIFVGITLNTYSFLETVTSGSFTAFSQSVFLAANVIVFLPLLVAIIGKSNLVSNTHINISMSTGIVVFLFNLIVFYLGLTFNFVDALSINNPILVAIMLTTSISFPLIFLNAVITTSDIKSISNRAKITHLICYLGMSLFMYITLYVNAILNIKDTSWGTKGLDKDVFSKTSVDKTSANLATYQYGFLLFYIGINTLFVVFSITTLFSMALFMCIFVVGLYQWSKLNFEYNGRAHQMS